MALTIGEAPFGRRGSGEFNFDTSVLEAHTLYFEDSPKRVRAEFGGETVVDSRRAKLLHETGYLPVYYFPEEDLNPDLLHPTDHTTHCPFKGDAGYRSVEAGSRTAENAVWAYPNAEGVFAPLAGYAAIYFGAMDHWYEEDEEIHVHPRDPYTRVDVLDSSRHVRVLAGGETVAETDSPKLLFETGLPVRYYIPPEDVRTEALSESESRARCPYKGEATYYSVETGDVRVEDAGFSYPEPLKEAREVADHFCFLGEGVTVEVDGEPDPEQ
ncbi:DUF427 domain-containing protein [Rubrobacter aplysinae]|uniref:DUF427 domain-containing protein n=1 Tax=Rubrobacter aplysinae TaxID=909625 RepID=UPI00064C1770|nr:DUF427 domain-containing protein [Rubrobacter aplysinae]